MKKFIAATLLSLAAFTFIAGAMTATATSAYAGGRDDGANHDKNDDKGGHHDDGANHR